MGNSVSFSVTAGPMKGKAFEFAEHDTFLFGSAEECHCRLPDDGQVSRRHFIVEVNPMDKKNVRRHLYERKKSACRKRSISS